MGLARSSAASSACHDFFSGRNLQKNFAGICLLLTRSRLGIVANHGRLRRRLDTRSARISRHALKSTFPLFANSALDHRIKLGWPVLIEITQAAKAQVAWR